MTTFNLSGSTTVALGDVERNGQKKFADITRTGDITAGGLISNLSVTTDLIVGMDVTGTGVVGGSKIASIPGGTSVQLSPNSGHTPGTGVSFTFAKPVEPDVGMSSKLIFFDPRRSTRTLLTKRAVQFVWLTPSNWAFVRAALPVDATQAIIFTSSDISKLAFKGVATQTIIISDTGNATRTVALQALIFTSNGDGVITKGVGQSSAIVFGQSTVLGVIKNVSNTSAVKIQSGGYAI